MRVLLRFMLAYKLFWLAANKHGVPRKALLGGPLAQFRECAARRWRLLELAGLARAPDTRVYTQRLVVQQPLQKNQYQFKPVPDETGPQAEYFRC